MSQAVNVIQILSDQHIADCMGCAGHPQAITPNMDKLAAKGVRFTSAYTVNPICTPSRVSMISGQYPHNHGYYGLSGPQPGQYGTRIIPHIFGQFKKADYRTAGVGNLHFPTDPYNWAAGDMDLYADCSRKADGSQNSKFHQYLDELGLRDKEDSAGLPEFPGKQQMEGRPSFMPYEHNVESWCAQQAVDFITESHNLNQPFFMQVSLPRPHQCYTPDQRFWDMYPDDIELPETVNDDPSGRPPHFQRMVAHYVGQGDKAGLLEPKGVDNLRRRIWRAYLACITQCDDALGKIMTHLEKLGMDVNTVIMYAADHGAYSTHFGLLEKAPGICSEKVCRVPMIWYAPGVSQAGAVCEQFASHVDMAPTFCALAGIEPMTTVDGFDLSPLLRGDHTPVRETVVTEHAWSKSLRYKQWRFVHYQREMFNKNPGEESDVGQLYDIIADPHERNNLYHDPAYQTIVSDCRRRVLEWLISTSRVVTCHPAVNTAKPMEHHVDINGLEPHSLGPAQRKRAGYLDYI